MHNLIQGNLVPIRQSTLVEVPLPATVGQNQNISFGNQNTLLDNAVITSIETFTSDQLSKAPSGNDVISPTDLTKLLVTLADTSQNQNFEFIKNYPLYNFVTSLNAGVIKEILYRFITLNKCNVIVADPTVTAGRSVVFAINYWTPEQYALFLEQMGRPQEAKNVKQIALQRKPLHR